MFNLGLLGLEFARPRRAAVLGDLRQDARPTAASSTKCPRSSKDSSRSCRDIYFCNFSVFQSLPDSWAIDQLFPIMPIHRLERAADAQRRAGRHHLRLRRQDRSLREPARRRSARSSCTSCAQARSTTSPRSWSAPTRKRSATCTTCSATRTSCTSACTTKAAGGSRKSSRATPPTRCSSTWSTTSTELFPQLARDCERAVREGRMTLAESQALRRFYEGELNGYTYLEPD